MTTSIEWAQNADGTPGETWNPTRGCDKVSPGCKHCYAETFAERWRGIPGHPYERGFDFRLVPDALDKPLRKKKPTTYFVNSMSDLFHKDVPDEYLWQVFAVMANAPQHTFQILTKRSRRMADLLTDKFGPFCQNVRGSAFRFAQDGVLPLRRRGEVVDGERLPDVPVDAFTWPLPNVWLGVSVEDREHGLPRLDDLRRTPAAVRMVSVEPLLEDLGQINLEGVGWVICGGESGAGARPFFIQWARDIRDQCKAAGVPFFFKQAGSHVAWNGWSPPGGWWPKGTLIDDTGRGHFLVRLKAKKGGELEELPEDLRVREFPR